MYEQALEQPWLAREREAGAWIQRGTGKAPYRSSKFGEITKEGSSDFLGKLLLLNLH